MGSFIQEQRDALRRLLKGIPIENGKGWLFQSRLNNQKGCGWPHLTDQDIPTVWGGTLDGIRALAAAGVSLYDPIIQESLKWLFEQQNQDGGFGSREVVYSAVESTSWVLITLKQIGYDLTSDTRMKKAVAYLETCVSPNGELATSPLDIDIVRTYPTVLTLWALYGYSEKTKLIARFLKDIRDNDSGGWGKSPNATPNALSTSQILHVLISTENLEADDLIAQAATKFILSTQNDDGSWDNYNETWFSKHQPHIPLRCDEYTTAWALTALITKGLDITSEPLVKAISWLVYQQKPEGYWLYDPLDESKHIWCVSDSIVALVAARKELLKKLTDQSTLKGLENEEEKNSGEQTRSLARRALFILRDNFFNILVVGMALYIFRDFINGVIQGVFNFLQVQTDNVVANLLANALWIGLVIAGTYLLNIIRNRRVE